MPGVEVPGVEGILGVELPGTDGALGVEGISGVEGMPLNGSQSYSMAGSGISMGVANERSGSSVMTVPGSWSPVGVGETN